MEKAAYSSSKKNDILSASELSQYTYCSMSWYLQRRGYKPCSPLLEPGKDAHTKLGTAIDTIQTDTEKSRYLAILGYILLFIVCLLILMGVLL